MDEQRIELVDGEAAVWRARFDGVQARILRAIPDAKVEHIGSTAVSGLPAKDVVDVLVGVGAAETSDAALTLEREGFVLEGQRGDHVWLSSPSVDAREVIVHVMVDGSADWCRRIRFRDLLRTDEEARNRYLAAKLLARDTTGNWRDYTAAKWDVVRDLLEEGRRG